MKNLHPIIAIEGIDGAGKTLVSKQLALELNGKYIKTPDTQFSHIREHFDAPCVDPRARMHFYIACLWDAYRKAARVAEFKPVIFDRYIMSTYAYHKALCNNSREIDLAIEFSAPPSANINILLWVSPETAAKRLKKRGRNPSGDRLEQDAGLQLKAAEILVSSCDAIIDNDRTCLSNVVQHCIRLIRNISERRDCV